MTQPRKDLRDLQHELAKVRYHQSQTLHKIERFAIFCFLVGASAGSTAQLLVLRPPEMTKVSWLVVGGLQLFLVLITWKVWKELKEFMGDSQ